MAETLPATSGEEGTSTSRRRREINPHLVAAIALLLRYQEAAAVLGVSERAVYQLVRDGTLTPIHIPGMSAVRLARAEVEALAEKWIQAAKAKPAQRRAS